MLRACACGRVKPCPEHPDTEWGGSTRRWRTLRAAVLERDGYRCRLRLDGCTTTASHAHHVKPKSMGGRDELGNLVASCPSCNLRMGDMACPVG